MNTETIKGQIVMVAAEVLIIGVAMVVTDKVIGRVFRKSA